MSPFSKLLLATAFVTASPISGASPDDAPRNPLGSPDPSKVIIINVNSPEARPFRLAFAQTRPMYKCAIVGDQAAAAREVLEENGVKQKYGDKTESKFLTLVKVDVFNEAREGDIQDELMSNLAKEKASTKKLLQKGPSSLVALFRETSLEAFRLCAGPYVTKEKANELFGFDLF